MLIYLLRHGDAPYSGMAGERSLSAGGKKDLESVLSQHFDDVLRPESSVAAVESRVGSMLEEAVLLLGHQPLIGKILEYLTDQTGLGWSMTTSSLACLDVTAFSRGCAELKWLTTPEPG